MMSRRRRAARAALLVVVAAAAAAALAPLAAAQEQQLPPAPAFDLRPQAADLTREALATFEAQAAERAKEDEVYIVPAPGHEEEEEGEAGGGGDGAAAAAAASAAAVAAASAQQHEQQQPPSGGGAALGASTAAAPTPAARPPPLEPRAMAVARGTVQPAAATPAAAATPPNAAAAAPAAPSRMSALSFPTSFPPTPSAQECASALAAYRASFAREPAPYDGPDGRSLLYFLHIPRTAGRTFHVCMLRQATPPDRRCPKSYDHLRVDVALPKCHLLSSHDDFSVVERLPAETSVVTQLRDPVDRFLSAYEFAAEVAARAVLKADPFARAPTNKTVTEDVWPWSMLVPWFVREAKARIDGVDAAADAREADEVARGGSWIAIPAPDGRDFYYNAALNASSWTLTQEQRARLLPPLDPYDNPLIPSLAEFARHPLARELLHEGQALQVLGLTNYSHWDRAPALRACAFGRPDVARELLGVARARLGKFAHVGSTGRLKDSVEAAAASIGAPLLGTAFSPGTDDMSSVSTSFAAAAAASSSAPLSAPPGGGAAAPGRPAATPVRSAAHPRASQLAAAARRAADRVRRAEDRWNAAVARTRQGLLPIGTDPRADPVMVAQPEFRALKRALGRARAELVAAQGAVAGHRRELRARGWLPSPAAASPAQADGLPPPGEAARDEHIARERERVRLAGGLGAEFQRCARRAQAKNIERRERSLINLMMPDGRTVQFTKAARAAIPASVLREIRSLNPMDDALHRAALEALDARRARFEAAGRLQAMPGADEGAFEPRRAREAGAGPAAARSRWAKVFPLPPGERGGAGGGGGGGGGTEL
jgi:hypothetical protein